MNFHKILIFQLIIFAITGCSKGSGFDSNYYCQKFQIKCTRINQLVTFKTSKGNFDVELNGVNYPLTVNNFLDNVKNNIYQNKSFYKIIKFPNVKVIHAGMNPINHYFQEKNQNIQNMRPSIPLEIYFNRDKKPKYKRQIKDSSEFDNIKYFFRKGSLAMVKSGEKKSSSTEFFFVTNSIPELDGRYSIFGQVIKGFDVIKKIEKEDFIYEIKILN